MAYATHRRKKTLTPEQLAESKARREVIRKLATTIQGLSEEERLQMAATRPVLTTEGRVLSPFNCCLVASQNLSATIVGGFHQWGQVGRQVKKGKGQGIAIYAPKHPGKAEASPVDEMQFLLVWVFDITSTEPKDQEQAAAMVEAGIPVIL